VIRGSDVEYIAQGWQWKVYFASLGSSHLELKTPGQERKSQEGVTGREKEYRAILPLSQEGAPAHQYC
jgi:hypothetical protein